MNLIGRTASGTLLVEMSDAEYAALGDVPRPEGTLAQATVYDLGDIDVWLHDFQHEFKRLELSARVHNNLSRWFLGPLYGGWAGAVKEDQERSKNWGYEYFGYRDRYRFSLDLVTQNGQLLSFADWLDVLPQRREQLKQIYNVGQMAIDELLTAAQRLHAERILSR